MRKIEENVYEIKDEDIVKVNCNFCGKELDCPKNMLVMTALKRLGMTFQPDNWVKFMFILIWRNLKRICHLFL